MYGLRPDNENKTLKNFENFGVAGPINLLTYISKATILDSKWLTSETACIPPLANLELKLSSLAVSHYMVFFAKSCKNFKAAVALLERKPP